MSNPEVARRAPVEDIAEQIQVRVPARGCAEPIIVGVEVLVPSATALRVIVTVVNVSPSASGHENARRSGGSQTSTSPSKHAVL